MEERKVFNSGYGIIAITLIVIIGFVVGFILINGSSKSDNKDNSNTGNSNINTNDGESVSNQDVSVDDSTKSIISEVIEKYYQEIFYLHSSAYCGDIDINAAADEIYFKNKNFNSIDSIASYYGSIITKKYFDYNLKDMFIEENGNLYCKMFQGASLEYEKNSFSIIDIRKSDDKIIVQGNYKTLESDLYPSKTFNVFIAFVNVDGSWVIDSCEETK